MMQILLGYPHIIFLILWFGFFLLVFLRYLNYGWCARLSWKFLVVTAVALHLAYGVLLTWGQYVTWGGNPATRVFLEQPLPREVPLVAFLESARPLLEKPLGYFVFYAFGRFWVSIILLLGLTGFFATLLKMRAYCRPDNFRADEIAMITLALLISGWPGIIVLVPLSFCFAVVFSFFSSFFLRIPKVHLAPSFLFAAPLSLALGVPVLKFLELYTTLKL